MQQEEPLEIKTDSINQPFEQSSSRLIINRIIMDNFKSYYGRLEIGPFHRRFTSIVGPNGSGKSNTIESLLFIFGKRASWMRLKQLHQLIHHSAQHNNVKKASVEVEFMEVQDIGNEIQELPNTKFRVKRTVHHTNQSHYELDGNQISVDELTKLLSSKGIDLTNNRFLILQGEVEQIAMMRPKSGDTDKPGLLEYLEDIIGSNMFLEAINQLVQDCEKLDQQKLEKGQLMKIVEADLEKLEPAKNKAIEFVQREHNLLQLQSVQQQVICFKYRSQIKHLTEEQVSLEQKMQEAKHLNSEKVKENAEVLQQFKLASVRVKSNKENIDKMKFEMDKLNEEDNKVRLKLKSLAESDIRLKKKLDETQKEHKKCFEELGEIEKDILPKSEKLKDLQKMRDEEEEKFRAMDSAHRDRTQELLKERKQLEEKINPQVQEKHKLERSLDVYRSKLESLSKGAIMSEKDLKELEKKLMESDNSIKELNQVIEKLQDVMNKIKEEKIQQSQKNQDINNQRVQYDGEIKMLQQKIDSFQRSQSEQQETNTTIKAIMEASQKGQLPGVIGKMGDLGVINPQYDIAATTSCSGNLNSILVENDDCAQRCINFLRQNKIGRQQFISFERIKQNLSEEMKRNFEVPQNCQRLFDLVQPKKEEYRIAFFKVFGQTLVCENIDIAKHIRFTLS